MEDEPKVKLMDEVKAFGDQNEVLQASKTHRIAYRHQQRKKESLVLYLALVQPHLLC